MSEWRGRITDSPPSIRVGIVDDHPMFRLGLEAAISEMPGIELVARAGRAADVEPMLADREVDVLLLDVRLEDGSGLEVNRWVNRHQPGVRVVMLTMSEDHDTALTALRDGARGYLVKGAGPERVEHAIRTAMAGDVVIDQSMVTGVTELAEARRTPPSRPFPELTDREFDVLALVAGGMDNASIARTLVLSPKTVRNHVSNVFAKIDASDRASAIVIARRQGLGD
jgi:DNA-binding NarL/FixJ family response regulator